MVGEGRGRALVLVGPTASGKTAVALEIARLLNVEIVSADSRQIYRFLDIGTAKPSREQRALVPHHFIDERNPDQEFSAGEFGVLGRERIEGILGHGAVPLVVGGSGLYVQALIDGLFDGPGADSDYRATLERRLREGEHAALMKELLLVDPESARTIDPTKPRRIIRALEVFHLTGIPLSWHQQQAKPAIPFVAVQVGLLWEREPLYRRIDERCASMVQNGLLEEAEGLLNRGYHASLNALNTVGYREAFACLRGECTRQEMLSLLQQNSRRYAKRQMTWFRRDERILWLPMENPAPHEIARQVVRLFGSFGSEDQRVSSL